MSAERNGSAGAIPSPSSLRSAGAAELSIALPPEMLDALADRLAPRVAALLQETAESERWLNSAQAADYLGLTRNALHKLTSAREIPFEQDGPSCKLFFRRSELDAWRAGERPRK